MDRDGESARSGHADGQRHRNGEWRRRNLQCAAVATGQCSLVLNTTGIRTITATYAGDTNFNTSSDTEDHTVCGDSMVTTNPDSGPGSLRQIIADACDNSTITLISTAPARTRHVDYW